MRTSPSSTPLILKGGIERTTIGFYPSWFQEMIFTSRGRSRKEPIRRRCRFRNILQNYLANLDFAPIELKKEGPKVGEKPRA